jgi:hypothetical protein
MSTDVRSIILKLSDTSKRFYGELKLDTRNASLRILLGWCVLGGK